MAVTCCSLRHFDAYVYCQVGIIIYTIFISIVLTCINKTEFLLNGGVGLWCSGFILLATVLVSVFSDDRDSGGGGGRLWLIVVSQLLAFGGSLGNAVVDILSLSKLSLCSELKVMPQTCKNKKAYMIFIGVSFALMVIELILLTLVLFGRIVPNKERGQQRKRDNLINGELALLRNGET